MHAGSRVAAYGTRRTAAALQWRYRCLPVGRDARIFAMLVSADGRIRPFRSAQPPCPDHEHGRVARSGTYGQRTANPRQRQRCIHAKNAEGEDVWHTFTRRCRATTCTQPRARARSASNRAECTTGIPRLRAGTPGRPRGGPFPGPAGDGRALRRRVEVGAADGRWRGRGGANSPKDPDAPERDPLPRSTAGSDVWHIAADRVEAVGPCAPRRPAEPRG
jgi:hypothetical protein